MKFRSRSVLAKLISLLALPLISLVVLWAIAASATLGQGVDLLKINDEVADVVNPLQDLGRELRAERLESVIAVAAPERNPGVLRAQRERTDRALDRFRDRAVDGANTDAVRARVNAFLDGLDDLADRRSAIDRRAVARLDVVDYYTGVLDRTLPIVTTIPHLPVSDYALRANATLELATAIETQSQEMAVLAGAAAGGGYENGEYVRAVELIGAQRRFYSDVVPQLEPVDRDAYRDLAAGSAARQVTAAEDAVLKAGAGGARPPIDADGWIDDSRALSHQMVEYSLDVSDRLFDDFIPTAIWVLVRIAVGGVLGLIAVIVSVIVSLRIGRSLVRELVGVQRSAQSLAAYELPAVVRRLRAGESVDVDAEVQPMTGFQTREIQAVAEAMDAARSTAVEVAIEEAQLRRGVREVFLNLARRSQTLVHRQLTLLDAMERREKDPDELEDLFALDHLATRMRRHAEDLIVLSGSTPGRGWRNPVPLVDVMRGAVAEVEDYARVRVVGAGRASLAGRAVSDVIHLLAELIENATSFSPPHTTVHVSGELVPAGYAIEIEDRGLGMPADQLAAVNSRLSEPPEFDLLNSERLGLFVVGQLARRHEIKVVLRGSPFGGTTAIVLLPIAMVVVPEDTGSPTAPAAGPEVAPAGGVVNGPPTLTIAPDLRGDTAPDAAVEALTALDTPPPAIEPPPVFDPAAWSGGTDWVPAEPRPQPEAESAPAPQPPPQPQPEPEPQPQPQPQPDDEPAGAPHPALPPLARRDPGAGWEHLTAQGPDTLPRRERHRSEPPADGAATTDTDVRPRGVARPPLASRGIPGETVAPDDVPAEHVLGGPVRPPEPEPAAVTPGGLPRRVRQANLAAQLRADSGVPPAPVEPTTTRSPEEIRAVMGSYQRGSLRGRSDAARTIPGDDPGAGAPDGVSGHSGDAWSEGQIRPDEVSAGHAREGER